MATKKQNFEQPRESASAASKAAPARKQGNEPSTSPGQSTSTNQGQSSNQGTPGQGASGQGGQGSMSQGASSQRTPGQGATGQGASGQGGQGSMSQGASSQRTPGQGATGQGASGQGGQGSMGQGASSQRTPGQGATGQGASSQGANAQGATGQGSMSQGGTSAQRATGQGATGQGATQGATGQRSTGQHTGADQDLLQHAKHATGEIVNQVQQQAGSQLARQKESAATDLTQVVQAVRRFGESLTGQEGGPIARYAAEYGDKAANSLERFSTYIREQDPKQLLNDVQNFGRRRPALLLGGAFLLGLAGARLIKSSLNMDSQQSFRANTPAMRPPTSPNAL